MSTAVRTPVTRYAFANGTTGASAAIPDGIGPDTLIVIDWIVAAGLGGTTMNVVVGGVTIASIAGAAGGVTWAFDFSGGYPLWATASSFAPMTSVAVANNSVTSAALITVGYHYERPSGRQM